MFFKGSPAYYLSSPSLAMHKTVLSDIKIPFKEYRYYDRKTKVFCFSLFSVIKSH